MTTDQIHRFLKYNLGLTFEGLSTQSGLEIWFNNRNLDTIAHYIEEYMGFDRLPDVSNEFEELEV